MKAFGRCTEKYKAIGGLTRCPNTAWQHVVDREKQLRDRFVCGVHARFYRRMPSRFTITYYADELHTIVAAALDGKPPEIAI